MSYTDLRDFEAEAVFTFDEAGFQTRVKIAAMGGGTVGRAYAGTWRYIVTCDGIEVARGQDFTTGMPKTHAEAAEMIYEYFSEEL